MLFNAHVLGFRVQLYSDLALSEADFILISSMLDEVSVDSIVIVPALMPSLRRHHSLHLTQWWTRNFLSADDHVN